MKSPVLLSVLSVLFVFLILLVGCDVATEPIEEPVLDNTAISTPVVELSNDSSVGSEPSTVPVSSVFVLPVPALLDLCANMTCPAGRECRNGVCACPVGKLSCQERCADCCSSKDCGTLSACVNGTCAQPSCDWNQEFKEGIGDCGCVKGNRWCPDQKLCIPEGLCCSHSECPEDKEFCNAYRLQTTVCYTMKNPSCKKILEYQKESLEGIILRLREIRQGGLMVFDVGNTTYHLKQNESVVIGNATLSAYEIVASGGNCRPVRE